MWTSTAVKCTLSNKLGKESNFIRHAQFSFTDRCTIIHNNEVPTSTFNIVTEDRDLKLVWIITQSVIDFNFGRVWSWKWNKIMLQESNKKMQCYYSIRSLSNDAPIVNRTFSSDSLPHEQVIDVKTFKAIFFNINIYYEDDTEVLANLIGDYSSFLENKNLSDVTFVVGKEEIPAHQVILSAHSKVFTQMFASDMQEKRISRVEVTDIEPDVFKMFLRLIYSDKFYCDNTEQLINLIVVADKYAVKGLVNLCQSRISEKLSIDNVVEALIVADLVNADILKKKCIDFIIKNKDDIIDTNSFKNMVKSGNADLVLDLFRNIKCL